LPSRQELLEPLRVMVSTRAQLPKQRISIVEEGLKKMK